MVAESDQEAYNILRRGSGDLPVYQNYKNGRTRVITSIRKVEGNVSELVKDLGRFIPPQRITMHLGGNVRINGRYGRPIRKWLTMLKF